MTTIAASAPANATSSASDIVLATGQAEELRNPQKKSQFLARMTGFLFIVTFVTSIPPFVWFYAPAVSDPGFVLGGGFDQGVALGAFLELLLILANIGTALTLYPVLKARFEVLSLAYVTARLVESGFIAVGIIAIMALNTLRQQADGVDTGGLVAAGQALVAVHDWTFRIGPGVVVGVGNGLILGYMMWKTRLVPRAMSVLGLIGGPLILLSGFAVIFGTIKAGSVPQGVATIPEFFWELSLGLWLLVKGFNPAALAELQARRS